MMTVYFSLKLLTIFLPFISFTNASPVRDESTKHDIQSQIGPVHVTTDNLGVYVRVARLNDNSLIAGYTTQEQQGTVNVLKTARSTDDGQSWRLLGEVSRRPVADSDLDNATLLQLPNGRVLYAFRNHDSEGQAPNKRYKWFRITITYSDDGGKTFTYLSTVEERAAAPGARTGLSEPFLRVARDGSVQCYYTSENNPEDHDGLMKYSRDGGRTWSFPILVSGGGVTSRDGMLGVAPMDNNGALIAVFQETEKGHFEISAVASLDDGLSWSGRKKVYAPVRGAVGAPQVCNVGGAIITGFMTNEDNASKGGNYDGGDMKVIISPDGGVSWGSTFVVGKAPVHWPGVFALDSSHFMASYSRDGEGALSQIIEVKVF